MRRVTVAYATLVSLSMVAPAAATCILSRDIDHSDRPDDKTLVFTMKDRSVFRNDLPVRCPNLHSSLDGYTLEPTDPSTTEVCDGMAVIRMNDQGHASCILGNFTRTK